MKAKERHPERWSKEAKVWKYSAEEWLNPRQAKETKNEAKASQNLKKGKVGRVTTIQKNSANKDNNE